MSNLRVCLAFLVALPFITEVPNKAFSMEDNNQSAKWDDLPKELQAKILGEHMGIKDNANAGLVSKDWHKRANDDVEWQKRYERDRQDLGKDLREGKTGKGAYVQSSFWSLKPSSYKDQMGCGYEATKNLLWCKFVSRLNSLYGGVAFIKRNENNGRQVKMLESGLTNALYQTPAASTEDFIKFENKYPKIQLHHSTTVHLNYSAIMEMCSNAASILNPNNTKPNVYSRQEGASFQDDLYPPLCKKINNDMLQGKDGTMLAYKFNVMMPAVDTAEHEAEVEFYLFPEAKS